MAIVAYDGGLGGIETRQSRTLARTFAICWEAPDSCFFAIGLASDLVIAKIGFLDQSGKQTETMKATMDATQAIREASRSIDLDRFENSTASTPTNR
jgi:hypothetical protein